MKELQLSKNSDVDLFIRYSLKLEEVGVLFTNKSTGPDQRYWDFLFEGKKLTLHLEHFLGISIFAEADIPDSLINRLTKH